MSETITVSKEEYERLMDYKRIVELEHDRPLSKELLKKLEKAHKEIEAGKGIVLHSKNEVKRYISSM